MKDGKFLNRIHEIIFEADTKEGKWFDIILLILIFLSVITVIIESVPSINAVYSGSLYAVEWVFTTLFTIEYIFRVLVTKKPKSYIFSFFGIIDFLSILPAYLGLFLDGSQYLVTLRTLRFLRIFRIFKLAQFVVEGYSLISALRRSRRKIMIFLLFVVMATVFMGSMMYVIESNQDSGFTSIPRGIYWAVVTLTTVGYGDIAPSTGIGQFIAALMMILGYAIIAVPTGIVGAEIVAENLTSDDISTQVCSHCNKEDHHVKAKYCYYCGEDMN